MTLRGWMLALLVIGPTAALTQSGLVAHAGEQYAPRLADIMNVAQVRHLKLYFAGRARNWQLAVFEARQLRANLAEAATLYSDIPVSNMTTLASRLQSLDDAIEAKSSQKFNRAFVELTGGCNECHQSMERPFIVMGVPTDQPFSNQVFATPRAR
jgi:hypothetical protein